MILKGVQPSGSDSGTTERVDGSQGSLVPVVELLFVRHRKTKMRNHGAGEISCCLQ